MNKLLIQLFLSILLFFAIWMGLSHIPWMEILEVDKKTSELETKLGDFYMDMISHTEKEITNDSVLKPLNEIKEKICKGNKIDPESIKIHLIKKNDANAFALPDRHLVIYSELVSFCKSPEELAGVIAHEIAHMENKHIMKKLSKEIGFSALSSMATGSSVGGRGLHTLTSTAYDRSMENQADEEAIKYLVKSKINPIPMADLMFRFSTEESDFQKYATFIATHPDSEKRAEKIMSLAKKEKAIYRPILSKEEWEILKNGCKQDNHDEL